MKIKLMIATVLAVFGVTAFGEGEFSDYLYLQSSDTSVNNSSFTRANWGENNEVVAAGNKYYVPSDMTLYSPYAGSTFAGDALAVAGSLLMKNQGYHTSTIKNLQMQPGSTLEIVQNSYLRGSMSVSGPVTVKYCNYSWSDFAMSVTGDEDSSIDFMNQNASQTPEQAETHQQRINSSDWTEFYGTARLKGNGLYSVSWSSALRTIGGTFEVLSGAVFYSGSMDDGTCSFAGFKLKSGSQLRYHFIPPSQSQLMTGKYVTYEARNAFEIGENVTIDFGGNQFAFNSDNIENPYKKLLHVCADADYSADLDSVILTNVNVTGSCGELPRVDRLAAVDNADGSKDICLTYAPITYMFGPCSSSGSSGKQAFNPANGHFWSTGTVPTSDFVGDVLVVSNRAFELTVWEDHNYPGMRLTIPKNTLYAQCSKLILDELHLVGGAGISAYYAASPTITANKIKIWPGANPVYISGWNRRVTLDAPLEGSGSILVVKTEETEGPQTLSLKGDNSNFTGAIVVNGGLVLQAGSNLGGAYSGEDSWKAVQINDGSTFSGEGSTVSSEASRGIYLNGAVEVAVASGVQLELDHPLTLGGTLTKTGTGTLKLGGTLAFSDDGATPTSTPTAGENDQIVVSNGSLMAVAPAALAGADVHFAAGGALAVDLTATNETVIARGTDFTSATFDYEAGRLYVVPLNTSGLSDDATVTRAICTVTAEQAESLTLKAATKVGRHPVTIAPQVNSDGSVTYALTLHPARGLTIIFN